MPARRQVPGARILGTKERKGSRGNRPTPSLGLVLLGGKPGAPDGGFAWSWGATLNELHGDSDLGAALEREGKWPHFTVGGEPWRLPCPSSKVPKGFTGGGGGGSGDTSLDSLGSGLPG